MQSQAAILEQTGGTAFQSFKLLLSGIDWAVCKQDATGAASMLRFLPGGIIGPANSIADYGMKLRITLDGISRLKRRG